MNLTGSLAVPTPSHSNSWGRLDCFAAQHIPHVLSRTHAQKLINNGHIRVNGRQVKCSHTIVAGLNIQWQLEDLQETSPIAQAMDMDILFEDQDVLVLNKPWGLVCHPGAGVYQNTLVNGLLHHCGTHLPSLGPSHRAGLVHRLDKDTSGVMVTAKNQRSLIHLSRQFAAHSQTRIYHALVLGKLPQERGSLHCFLARHPKLRTQFTVVNQTKGAKKALMDYEQRETLGLASWVQCSLHTGRTHQIRVQMKWAHCPILGDRVYGPLQIPSQLKALPAQRQLLHAHTLGFKHPRTEQDMIFTCPWPEDFQKSYHFLKSLTS